MGRCEMKQCNGHMAKFDNCLAEALYELGDMYADEHCGDTDGPGYMWLFLFDDSHRVEPEEWSGMFGFTIAAGTYVTLFTNDQGFVYLTGYLRREEAQAAYDEFEREYSLWAESVECHV